MIDKKSFIVTGASASGKTTLIEKAIKKGYIHLPTHTTRLPRIGEKNGLHNIFISEAEFILNFNNGKYLEESLDFARLHSTGIYYGTPTLWIHEFLPKRCATPTSINIARKLSCLENIMWIHLYCNDKTRKKRLLDRGISIKEVEARMNSGDSRLEIPNEAIAYDTSKINVDTIFNEITKKRKIVKWQGYTKTKRHYDPFTR
ncbi:MAG: hypothetical protein LBU87_03190 [Lactobacillales bacterium]|nr:hypothetical protein [Lactobacillales bacterium]